MEGSHKQSIFLDLQNITFTIQERNLLITVISCSTKTVMAIGFSGEVVMKSVKGTILGTTGLWRNLLFPYFCKCKRNEKLLENSSSSSGESSLRK